MKSIADKYLDKVSDTVTEKIDDTLFKPASYNESKAEDVGFENYSYWRSTFNAFLKNRMAMIAVILILVTVAFTLLQPILPNQRDPNQIFNDADGQIMRSMKPNGEYWFGTNNIGQDLWARIWSGTRTSLNIALIVAVFDMIVGILVGALWGYVRKLDRPITEIYNVLSNIPQTILLILLSYVMKPGVGTMVFAMCATGWLGVARFIRNQIVIIRDREYNLASRCLGTPTGRLISKNLLPYLVSVIMMRLALSIPGTIGREVFLTYVGLGLPVNIPSLGNLINEGRSVMMVAAQRYQLIFPAVILSIITISFYIMGNSFADAADPRNHI